MLARRRATYQIPKRLLSFDPGNCTGICFCEDGILKERLQIQTIVPDLGHKLEAIFDKYQPTDVVIEAYRIYSSKAAQHINSDVPTLQQIGRIKHICEMRNIPIEEQLASEGKSFWTDAMLEKLGVLPPIKQESHDDRHSRDAVRHALHRILFG